MPIEKSKVLEDAPAALNRQDQPWEVTVEGDCIKARWKWMDAAFFSPSAVTSKIKDYMFVVTLKDNGKWKELDKITNQSASGEVKLETGKLGGGAKFQTSVFAGKTTQKTFEFGIGKNRETGEVGAVGFKLDTAAVKQPIRQYLMGCGWKKSGLF